MLEKVMQELIEKRLGDAEAQIVNVNLENPSDDRKRCPTFVVATRVAIAEGPADLTIAVKITMRMNARSGRRHVVPVLLLHFSG